MCRLCTSVVLSVYSLPIIILWHIMFTERHFPVSEASIVLCSTDIGTLNGGSECFKAKARHVKEINVPLLSPALIRTLLSAENDRACTFHYVLLVSGAPHPSLLLALSSFLSLGVGGHAVRGKCEFGRKGIYLLEANSGQCECHFVCKCMFTQASLLFFVSRSFWLLSKIIFCLWYGEYWLLCWQPWLYKIILADK